VAFDGYLYRTLYGADRTADGTGTTQEQTYKEMPAGYAVAPDDAEIVTNVIVNNYWDVWRLCTLGRCIRGKHYDENERGSVSDAKHWESNSSNEYRIVPGNNWYRLLIRKRCDCAQSQYSATSYTLGNRLYASYTRQGDTTYCNSDWTSDGAFSSASEPMKFSGATRDLCQQRCNDEGSCKAYSFDKSRSWCILCTADAVTFKGHGSWTSYLKVPSCRACPDGYECDGHAKTPCKTTQFVSGQERVSTPTTAGTIPYYEPVPGLGLGLATGAGAAPYTLKLDMKLDSVGTDVTHAATVLGVGPITSAPGGSCYRAGYLSGYQWADPSKNPSCRTLGEWYTYTLTVSATTLEIECGGSVIHSAARATTADVPAGQHALYFGQHYCAAWYKRATGEYKNLVLEQRTSQEAPTCLPCPQGWSCNGHTASPYVRITDGNCDSKGFLYITTAEECKEAAMAVGADVKGGLPGQGGNRQRNCGTKGGHQWLHFNTQTSGYITHNGVNYNILNQATSDQWQICRRAAYKKLCTSCDYGGSETYVGTMTLDQCAKQCQESSTCTAIDFGKSGTVKADRCYFNTDTSVTSNPHSDYDAYVVNPTCSPGVTVCV
jgi:hypothetical protein